MIRFPLTPSLPFVFLFFHDKNNNLYLNETGMVRGGSDIACS